MEARTSGSLILRRVEDRNPFARDSLVRAVSGPMSLSSAVFTLGAVSSAAYYLATYRTVNGVYETIASEVEMVAHTAADELEELIKFFGSAARTTVFVVVFAIAVKIVFHPGSVKFTYV